VERLNSEKIKQLCEKYNIEMKRNILAFDFYYKGAKMTITDYVLNSIHGPIPAHYETIIKDELPDGTLVTEQVWIPYQEPFTEKDLEELLESIFKDFINEVERRGVKRNGKERFS
jgi:hypothetical protein